MAAIFKYSLQNLSPLPTIFKVKSISLAISWNVFGNPLSLRLQTYHFVDKI